MTVNRKLTVLLLILLMICQTSLTAQNFKAFVSAGLMISQLDGDEVYGFKHTGFTGGLGVMMPLNVDKPESGFQLSMEILFAQRGAKNTILNDPFEYKAHLNYIDIPFMAHYIDKTGGITVGLGLQYGRLIKQYENWTLPEPAILGMERPVVIQNIGFKKNDYSVVADVRFKIWKNLKFDFRYQYSLIPIRSKFLYDNSWDKGDNSYQEWKRDFKSNYMTLKLIYVINEEHQTYKAKTPKRKSAF